MARKKKAEQGPRLDTTGMLFVRDASGQPTADGRRLVMVVGILALPNDIDLPGEHQFVAMGVDTSDALHLTLYKEPRVDLTDEARGSAIGDLLLKPIWRT